MSNYICLLLTQKGCGRSIIADTKQFIWKSSVFFEELGDRPYCTTTTTTDSTANAYINAQLNHSRLRLSNFLDVQWPSTARDRSAAPCFSSSVRISCLIGAGRAVALYHCANVVPCLCPFWLCQPALNCVSAPCGSVCSVSHAWPSGACPSSLHLSEVYSRLRGASGCF